MKALDATTKRLAMKAYAVTENYENTGGILFARHAVTARRWGADQWGDGEFSAVSCRRAPWADRYAETGKVPASDCIWAGWHFECHYCGTRIDSDYDPYETWTPDSVVGEQNSAVYCDRSCEHAAQRQKEHEHRMKERVLAHYSKRLLARLPGITIRPLNDAYRGSHVYVDHNGRVEQVVVGFDWPGQHHGPAAFRWGKRDYGATGITCCFGDKDAFEAFARAQAEMIDRGLEE